MSRAAMLSRARNAAALCLILLSAAPHVVWSETPPLTQREGLGKRIYVQGLGTKPVKAKLSGPGIEVSGSDFACIKCHGEDGGGTREGGVLAADIGWVSATSSASGLRSRPAYDEHSLARAIRHGTDSAGNKLHAVMPRYALNANDMTSLIAYLRRLGNEPIPGLDDVSITLATLQPMVGELRDAGEGVTRLLSGALRAINQRGGIYGRKLRLKVLTFDPREQASALRALQRGPADTSTFALLAPLGLRVDDAGFKWLAQNRIPVIGPLTSPARANYLTTPHAYFVRSSLYDQARLLVDFIVAEHGAKAQLGIWAAADSFATAAADGVRAQAATHTSPVKVDLVARQERELSAQVSALKDQQITDALLFGATRAVQSFLREAQRQNWLPRCYLIADLSGGAASQVDAAWIERLWIASSSANPDPGAAGTREFLALTDEIKLTPTHRGFQLSAYAATKLLEHGLKQSGRILTRTKFQNALQRTSGLVTGVVPPLRFDENQRAGTTGALVTQFDPRAQQFAIVRAFAEPE